MENDNPFKAPEAVVADPLPDSGSFIPEGRQVPAGNGLAWLGSAWDLFRQAPGVWIILSVVYIIFFFVLGMSPRVSLLINLLVPIFTGGIMLGCKALEDGEEFTVSHLFAGFSGHAGKLALVGLIYLVGVISIVIVMVLMLGGMGFAAFAGGALPAMAMILPVLLVALLFAPLAMAVWYAPALVVFHDQTPFDAMKASFFVSFKNFLPFLVYGLAVLVLAILASLPIFLGWLVLLPVVHASIYTSYKDMFTES